MKALIDFSLKTLFSMLALLCVLVASIYALVAIEHLGIKLLAIIGTMFSILLILVLISAEAEKNEADESKD